MYRKFALAAFTALLTVATGCPATAQQVSRVVSYRDLDLTTPSGIRTLRRRLVSTVNRICRVPAASAPLLGVPDQDCRAQALSDVEPRMLHAVELAEKRAAETQLASR
jgi:UrcA family protein